MLEDFHYVYMSYLNPLFNFPPYYHAFIFILLDVETPIMPHFRCNAHRKNVCESIFETLLDIKGK